MRKIFNFVGATAVAGMALAGEAYGWDPTTCEASRQAYAGSSALEKASRKIAAKRDLEAAQAETKPGRYHMAVIHVNSSRTAFCQAGAAFPAGFREAERAAYEGAMQEAIMEAKDMLDLKQPTAVMSLRNAESYAKDGGVKLPQDFPKLRKKALDLVK